MTLNPSRLKTSILNPADKFFFTRLQYESGDWDVDQRMPSNVLNSLIEYTTLPVDTNENIVPLSGKQIFRWIHARGVTDPEKMSDLPASLRAKLAERGLKSVLEIVSERRATDDTRKLLVSLGDGANVETVLIPRVAGLGSG